MVAIIKQKSHAWKRRKASRKGAKRANFSKTLARTKKKNKRKKVEACPRLLENPNSWKSFDQPQRSHYRSFSSPRYALDNNTRNDGTKPNAQTPFIERGTVQHRKESIHEINWFLGSTSTHFVSRSLKLTML